jgi:hypothetical protein
MPEQAYSIATNRGYTICRKQACFVATNGGCKVCRKQACPPTNRGYKVCRNWAYFIATTHGYIRYMPKTGILYSHKRWLYKVCRKHICILAATNCGYEVYARSSLQEFKTFNYSITLPYPRTFHWHS